MKYPPAEWLGNGKSGGSYVDGPYRIVLHTTETAALPAYNDGKSAPHLTYDPDNRKWYQHTPLDTAARALRNSAGGVETNRQRALQVEIICYSAKSIADRASYRMWVGDLPATAYEDLRGFMDWAGTTFGVRAYWPGKQAYSYSEANAEGFRMTHFEWEIFDGVCAHQHVPENTHWDTGAFDWTRLLEDDMPLTPDDLQAISDLIDERLEAKLGATIPIPDEPDRLTLRSMVNALHAKSEGRKIYQSIDQARNFAKETADHFTEL